MEGVLVLLLSVWLPSDDKLFIVPPTYTYSIIIEQHNNLFRRIYQHNHIQQSITATEGAEEGERQIVI